MRGLLVIVALSLSLSATASEQTTPAVAAAHERLDPAFDAVFDSAAPVELLASGYGFTEGPVWMPQLGVLLFSDLPGNVVHKYDPRTKQASVHLLNAGFTGPDPWRWGGMSNNGRDRADPRFEEFPMLGPDGLAVDVQGRLILTTFAGRSIVRIEGNGARTVLADGYQGKRFNGTNDVIVKRDGAIYFTDTFGGLRKRADDLRKEIQINAVYRWNDGQLNQLITDMANTNGLAFSPDEKLFYVNASRDNYIRVYDVREDGTLANGRMFADLRGHAQKGVTDGMKVDTQGNVYVTGPGGIWVITPAGKHIGTIRVPEGPINLAFGDDDRKSLYITAHSGLYRARVKIAGEGAVSARSLPEPDGKHAVGMRRFELKDTKRQGVLSSDPIEPRVLPGYVWYPAKLGARGMRPYLISAEAALQGPSMARNFDYDASELKELDQVIAHSVEDAPPALSPSGSKFPILIFNHGYECYPAQNTALLERLASHGYIVISIGHPHDAVDLQLSDGAVLRSGNPVARDAEYAELRRTLAAGPNHDARTAALKDYAQAFSRDRLGASLAAWRDDTLFTARAILKRDVPSNLRTVLAQGDVRKLGFIGMSFGGATAASTCRLVSECRAVINLDGGNYDPALFNASVERPMLLMMSDWVTLPLPGRPNDPAFHFNDYAYEPWSRAGLDPNVVRVRLEGLRHMGYTDLILLMRGANHEAQFGTVAPEVAVESIGAASIAFLDQHLKADRRASLAAVVKDSPVLRLHSPESVRQWASASEAATN